MGKPTVPEFAGTRRFEIRRRLGAGAMGVVYEAFDRERGQPVALKTLQRFEARDLRRFKTEFRALHDIDHPNLGQLYELLEENGMWFFTMELIRGVDFLSHVRPNSSGSNERGAESPRDGDTTVPTQTVTPSRPLSSPPAREGDTADRPSPRAGAPVRASAIGFDERRLRDGLRQLAQGITALHAAGKLHRDIKPNNVMVEEGGRVVLLDFGLVIDVTDPDESEAQFLLGTPAYMAPEQATDAPIGFAADWYAFGTVLYKALVGVTPYSGRSPSALLDAKQRLPATPPRQHLPDVPEDLDALCVELLRRNPAERPPGRTILRQLGTAQPGEDGEGEPTESITPTTPFVGRKAELGVLRAAFERSIEQPEIVVIHGESGVGKSELVQHFIRQLVDERADAAVLTGRCYERESVDYKGLDGVADSLSRYMSLLPKNEAAALLPTEVGRLVKLFPVLTEVEAIAQAPREADLPNPHEQRLRMFSAFREVLARLAKRHPLVVFIDDLQWIAADTISLLTEILGHTMAPRLLLIGTMRPSSDEQRERLLARLGRMAEVEQVRLRSLPVDEATTLARLLLPSESERDLSVIINETAGHPMFIQELARRAGGLADGESLSLDEALWARIVRLPAEQRRLLEVVCVAGRPLAQKTASNAAELAPGRSANATRALRAVHLVRTDGVRQTDSIAAYHDRVREIVTAKLDGVQRRYWHQRIAVSLERAGAAKTDPQRLVRHAEAAGDLERAAEYAQIAAAHAMQTMAFDNAAELLRAALRFRDYSEDDARALRLRLAEALVNAGRGPEAAEAFSAAAVGAPSALQLDCQRRATEQWLISGHLEHGLDAVRTLLARVDVRMPATPRGALMSLLWGRAKLRMRGLRWKDRDPSDIPRSDLTRIDIYKTVSTGLGVVDTVRGHDFHARAFLAALRTGERSRVGWAMAYDSVAQSCQGGRKRFARAEALAARVASITGDDRYLRAWTEMSEGCLAYFRVQYRRCDERLAAADALLREQAGTTWELNTARLFRMWCLLRMGALGDLAPLVDEYLRDASRRGDLYMRTSVIRSCHTLWLARDTLEGAGRILDDARWTPPEGRYHLQHWFALKAAHEMQLCSQPDAPPSYSAAEFEPIKRSLLMRILTVRNDVRWLRGRLAIASASQSDDSAGLRREAMRMARLLEREDSRDAILSAALLRAAKAAQEGDTEGAISLLASTASRGDEWELYHHAAAARHRQGELAGGDEGKQLIAEADAWASRERVRNPAWMIQLYAPGFHTA